jgi:hypothetical protein
VGKLCRVETVYRVETVREWIRYRVEAIYGMETIRAWIHYIAETVYRVGTVFRVETLYCIV